MWHPRSRTELEWKQHWLAKTPRPAFRLTREQVIALRNRARPVGRKGRRPAYDYRPSVPELAEEFGISTATARFLLKMPVEVLTIWPTATPSIQEKLAAMLE